MRVSMSMKTMSNQRQTARRPFWPSCSSNAAAHRENLTAPPPLSNILKEKQKPQLDRYLTTFNIALFSRDKLDD